MRKAGGGFPLGIIQAGKCARRWNEGIGMRQNIMIVDDEPLIRQGFLARLEYLQIERGQVFEASSGREALQILQDHALDVIVTDIRMPDMDGLELIRQAKERGCRADFVVLSGYAEFSYAEQAIRLGVREYLLKPLSNEELKRAFDRLYAEREQRAQTDTPDVLIHLLGVYLENGEIDKIPDLLTRIFPDEVMQTHDSSYLDYLWTSCMDQILQNCVPEDHLQQGAHSETADLWKGGHGQRGVRRETAELRKERLIRETAEPDRTQAPESLREELWRIVLKYTDGARPPEADLGERIRMARQYIESHYQEDLTVSDLAQRYGMSPNYFSSAFKREMNCSAVSCITGVRLQKAKELLSGTDDSVAEIALRVGFRESQYFFRVFKQNTGMTPLQYRESCR